MHKRIQTVYIMKQFTKTLNVKNPIFFICSQTRKKIVRFFLSHILFVVTSRKIKTKPPSPENSIFTHEKKKLIQEDKNLFNKKSFIYNKLYVIFVNL